jgi:hypothetical protein
MHACSSGRFPVMSADPIWSAGIRDFAAARRAPTVTEN